MSYYRGQSLLEPAVSLTIPGCPLVPGYQSWNPEEVLAKVGHSLFSALKTEDTKDHHITAWHQAKTVNSTKPEASLGRPASVLSFRRTHLDPESSRDGSN